MRQYDDKIIGSMLLTAVGISMAAALASAAVSFKAKLSADEQKLSSFAPAVPVLTVRTAVATSGADCPVATNRAAASLAIAGPSDFPPGAPPVPEPPQSLAAIETPSSGPAVSFIMLDSSRRLAIVNGKVVKEGDRFQNGTISRIEANRLLFKEGKGEQWLHLR